MPSFPGAPDLTDLVRIEVSEPMTEATQAPKSGIKTSEFWLSAAAAVVGLLTLSGVFPEGTTVGGALAVAATALASLGYSYSRGQAKKGA